MARRAQRKWKTMSGRRRFWVVSAATIELGLKLLAWRDLARRPAAQINGRKAAWFAATFINTFGPIAYFLFGRRPASLTLKHH
ncbi:PLDc N-terminal domain-containing protein [Sinomonas sp.]|jgi:predicted cobalt transporter CbtA|uniref:PLDc N-terminal domain-containing protein n=1 Tax=Sinomonas sp. TaxID=1914986 RepID=UPI002FDF35D2